MQSCVEIGRPSNGVLQEHVGCVCAWPVQEIGFPSDAKTRLSWRQLFASAIVGDELQSPSEVQGPQRERTLRDKQDHKDEEEQEDHVKVKCNQDGGKLGQDQVKLSQDDAEPDRDDKVHVTSARTGDAGWSNRQSTFRRCQGEPVKHQTAKAKAIAKARGQEVTGAR